MNNEVAKFNQLSESWWDTSGPLKTLHDVNPTRVNFIGSLIPVTHQRILDVGCGAGILTEALAQKGAHMVGLDLAQDSINAAKVRAQTQNLNIEYTAQSLETYGECSKDKFDAIVCMELLEHVDEPQKMITHMVNLLKPSGYMFLSTLNRTFKSYLLGIVGAEYLLKIIPEGTHQYEKFIKPSEVCRVTQSLSLETVEMKGLHYNPFTRTSKLIDDLSFNYLAAFKRV